LFGPIPRRIYAAGLGSRTRRVDPAPTWQRVFAVSFTGVRGIVSLAAALGLPLAVAGGPFPHRDLILVLTFSVILVTLVGQNLLLPCVMRALGLIETGRHEHDTARAEEYHARQRAIEAALERLDRLSREGRFAPEVLGGIRAQYQDRLKLIRHNSDADTRQREFSKIHDEIELSLIGTERNEFDQLFRKGMLNGEARRRIERELALREAQLLNDRRI
jgi:monovalent cation/hydrogen antiporter